MLHLRLRDQIILATMGENQAVGESADYIEEFDAHGHKGYCDRYMASLVRLASSYRL